MNDSLIQFNQMQFIWLIPLIILGILFNFINKRKKTDWFYPPLDQRSFGEQFKEGFFKTKSNYFYYRVLLRPKGFAGWLYFVVSNISLGFFIGLVLLGTTSTGYIVGIALGLFFFLYYYFIFIFYDWLK